MEVIALAEIPQVTPLEAAQIICAGLWPVFAQQLHCPAIISSGQRLLGEIDVGHVFIEQGRRVLLLGAAPLEFGLMAQLRFQ